MPPQEPGGRPRPGISADTAQSAVQVDRLADPNEIKTRRRSEDPGSEPL